MGKTVVVRVRGIHMFKYLDKRIGIYGDFIKEVEKIDNDEEKKFIIMITSFGGNQVSVFAKMDYMDKEKEDQWKETCKKLGYEVLHYPVASKTIQERVKNALAKGAIVGYQSSFFVPGVKI